MRDVPKLWSLLQGVDAVYHLRCIGERAGVRALSTQYNDVNVGGTVALLEACRDVGMKRVIFASDATVYGDQKTKPVSEDLAPHPAVPYAVSKLAAERYLLPIESCWKGSKPWRCVSLMPTAHASGFPAI